MRLTKTLIFMVFCCAVIGACGFILMHSLPELMEEPPARNRRTTRELVEPQIDELEPIDPLESGDGTPPVAECAIVGRLVDPGHRALEGFEIVCGEEESAATDASGRFAFARRSRPSPFAVTLRRGGKEVARWDGVLDLASSSAELPQVENVRWSVTLCSDAVIEAPLSGVDSTPTGAASFAPDQYLTLGAVLVEEWGWSGAVHLEGRARLPDGLHVYAAVYQGEDRLASGGESSEIAAGLFRLAMRLPEDFRFFSGAYDLKAFFSTEQEDFQIMEAVRQAHPTIPWERLSDYGFSQSIFVGSPQEQQRYDRLALVHYRSGFELVARLKKLYLHRRVETEKAAGGWDPRLLRGRETNRASWVRGGSVSADGFVEDDWRQFLDVHWRPVLFELAGRRLPGVKYPKATYHLEWALQALLKYSYVDSVALYRRLGLAPTESDRTRPGGVVAEDDPLLLLKMVDEHLKALKPYLDLLAAASRQGRPKPRIR